MMSNLPVAQACMRAPFSSSNNTNDENAMISVNKQTTISSLDFVGKTPASTKTRRAFGDISNRKPERNDGKSGVPLKTPSAKQTARTTTNYTKVTNLVNKSESTQLFNQKTSIKPSAIRKSLPKQRTVQFALPEQHPKQSGVGNNQPSIGVVNDIDVNSTNLDDSFDIIQPAGRTWEQQKANGDHDEQPDDLSLEGAATVYEDYMKSFKEDHEYRLYMRKLEDAEASKYIQDLVQAVDWVNGQDDTIIPDNLIYEFEILKDSNLDLSDESDFDDITITFPELQI